MNVEESVASLKAVIRDVPDFPKPGIVFKDITTLLKNPKAFQRALDLFTVLCGDHLADKVLAIESRGSSSGPPWPTGSASASCPCASRASCPARPSATPTRSNTARTASRSTKTP
jgi:adenine phosphoribosyltransferase